MAAITLAEDKKAVRARHVAQGQQHGMDDAVFSAALLMERGDPAGICRTCSGLHHSHLGESQAREEACPGHLGIIPLYTTCWNRAYCQHVVRVLQCVDPESGHTVLDSDVIQRAREGRRLRIRVNKDIAAILADMPEEEEEEGARPPPPSVFVALAVIAKASAVTGKKTMPRYRTSQSAATNTAGHRASGGNEGAGAGAEEEVEGGGAKDNWLFPVSERSCGKRTAWVGMPAAKAVDILREADRVGSLKKLGFRLNASDASDASDARAPALMPMFIKSMVALPPNARPERFGCVGLADKVTLAMAAVLRLCDDHRRRGAGRDPLSLEMRGPSAKLQAAVDDVYLAISERLSGKEGLFRGNLLGKRVNLSARTVVTGDPSIGLEEIGVPAEIAEAMLVPVAVTEHNLEYCVALVRASSAR